MIELNYENGEKFVVELRKSLKKHKITLNAVDRTLDKRKPKDKFQKLVKQVFNGYRDGIWRYHNFTDTTCTNLSELSPGFYKLGLHIDLMHESKYHGVKWSWSRIKDGTWEGQRSFSLKKETLKKLFAKIKKVLEKDFELRVDDILCETLGAVERKDIYIQITVVTKLGVQREEEDRKKYENIIVSEPIEFEIAS